MCSIAYRENLTEVWGPANECEGLWYVFAQVKTDEAIHSFKPREDSNQPHHSPLSSTVKVKVLPSNPISLSLPPSAVVLLCFHPSEPHHLPSFCHIPPLKIPCLFCAYTQAPSAQRTVFHIHASVPALLLFFIAPSRSRSHVQTQTGPFFLGGGGIFRLFSHSLTISLSQDVGLNRGVGKVEKVTLEINGACISLASPPPPSFPPVL